MRAEIRELRGEVRSQTESMQRELRALAANFHSLLHAAAPGHVAGSGHVAFVDSDGVSSASRPAAAAAALQDDSAGGRDSARLDWPSFREDSAGAASPAVAGSAVAARASPPRREEQKWV